MLLSWEQTKQNLLKLYNNLLWILSTKGYSHNVFNIVWSVEDNQCFQSCHWDFQMSLQYAIKQCKWLLSNQTCPAHFCYKWNISKHIVHRSHLQDISQEWFSKILICTCEKKSQTQTQLVGGLLWPLTCSRIYGISRSVYFELFLILYWCGWLYSHLHFGKLRLFICNDLWCWARFQLKKNTLVLLEE